MENKDQQLQTTQGTGALSTVVVTEEQKALVKSMIFPNSSDDELALFIFQCKRKGVHPLDRMIYPIKRGQGEEAKLTFQTGIDFMRSEAEGTGEYAGQDEPEFEWDEEKDPGHTGYPILARVKIYRKGFERPFIGLARWSEFYPGEKMGHMYRKMPCNQLAKCAEANGLRKAFPKILGDLYCPEEMQQADTPADDKKQTRSASVQSTTKSTDKVVDAEETGSKPLDETSQEIMEILAELNQGSWSDMDGMLKKVSEFPKKDPKTGKTTGVKVSTDLKRFTERNDSITEPWKKKILEKLRAMKGKADAKKAENEQKETGPDTEQQPDETYPETPDNGE